MASAPLKFAIVGGLVALMAIGLGTALVVKKLKGNLDGLRRSAGAAKLGAADRASLLRAENLGKAITTVASRAGPDPRVSELQLEPEVALFILRDGDSPRTRGWTYTSGGHLRPTVVEQAGPAKTAEKAFALRRAGAGTPEKIIDAIHRRDRRLSLKDVQSMTLGFDPTASRVIWSVSIGRGVTASLYEADLDGSHVRRPGVDPPRSSGGRASPYAGDPRAALARSERLRRCIARAHGDVAKLQACSP